MNNDVWAKALIDQLIEQKVTTFFIAPGSRSTPLTLAVAANPLAKSYVHFDERGLGFFALGYAKATNLPCAIIVTSGSALGNLYPAVIEASENKIPLILLTADRAFEDQYCGSNQTIDQNDFFSSFVRWKINLPCPENSLSMDYLQSTIAYSVYSSIKNPKGPVHLNCLFRKPLFIDYPPPHSLSSPLLFSLPLLKAKDNDLNELLQKLIKAKNGVIVLGNLPFKTDLLPLFSLASSLGFPIFADPLSNPFSFSERENLIYSYPLILKTTKDLQPDLVIQFGDRLVSDVILDWIKQTQPKDYILIVDHSTHYNPIHKINYRIESDIPELCKFLLFNITPKGPSELFLLLKFYDAQIQNFLSPFFEEQDHLTEGEIVHYLSQEIEENSSIFFANSMPIRNALNFFHPPLKINLFANRGASGIDGNIATTYGISQALNQKTYGIIGDQALLHDLNSLALIHKSTTPIHLIIFNNQGGGIFSTLPIASQKEQFEKFFQAKHEFNFEQIAKQFGIHYENIVSKKEISLISQKKSSLIEITTSSRNDNEMIQKLFKKIDQIIKYKHLSLSG